MVGVDFLTARDVAGEPGASSDGQSGEDLIHPGFGGDAVVAEHDAEGFDAESEGDGDTGSHCDEGDEPSS